MERISSTNEEETIHFIGVSVIGTSVCCWRDMRPPNASREDGGQEVGKSCPLIGQSAYVSLWYNSILSDHLHSFTSIVHSDKFRQCSTPHSKSFYRVAPRSIYLILEFSTNQLNPQIGTLLNIFVLPCNLLLKQSSPHRTDMDLWICQKD